MIVIVDYGMGNLASIANMLRHLGAQTIISSGAEDIKNASKLILPGVGSFDAAVDELHRRKIWPLLNEKASDRQVNILGICLGMQLMCSSSEEGKKPGLRWIDAQCRKFQFSKDSRLKVPHMGWNYVKVKKNNTLLNFEDEQQRFYFVHSYYVTCKNNDEVILTSNYGHDFVAAFQKENISGVQFHPEKSHRFGLKLLRNFAEV